MMNSSGFTANTTEIADRYLGNVNEDRVLQSEIALDRKCDRYLEVFIDRQDARKGRILVTSGPASQPSGVSIGIVKGRNWVLREGDVMLTQRQQRVLIHLKKQQVIALQFDRKAYNSPTKLMQLGHAIGNAHWSVVAAGETLYIEVTSNAERLESTLQSVVERLEIKGLHIVRESKTADQFIDFSTAASTTAAHTHAH